MGKQERVNKRRQQIKESTNPVGILSVEEFERIEQTEREEAPVRQSVPPVVKDLDNASSAVREQACMSISNIVLEDNGMHIPQLVEAGAMKKLVQKLCDDCQPVRAAAAGALKNVLIVGGESISDDLVKHDVVTALLAALNQSIIEQEQSVFTLTQIVHVLSFLCENSDHATRVITERTHYGGHSAVYCLIHILRSNTDPLLLTTTIQCLNVISDENQALQQQILNVPDSTQTLTNMLHGSYSILFKACVASVLFNISPDITGTMQLTCPLLLQAIKFDPVIQQTLLEHKMEKRKKKHEDIGDAQSQLLQDQENHEQINQFIKDQIEEEEEEEDDTVTEYKVWEENTKAHNMAFEVLTNMISALALMNDDAEYEDIDEEEDFDEQVEVVDSIDQNSQEVAQFVKMTNLLSIGLDRAVSLNKALTNPIFQQPYAAIEKDLLRDSLVRVLNLLNNIMLSMNEIPQAMDVWNFLTTLQDVDIVTSIMWTMLRKKMIQSNQITNQATIFANLVETSMNEEVRTNAIGILGEMGKSMSGNDSLLLAQLLLKRVQQDTSLIVVSEALNSIFDIFGDEVKHKQVIQQSQMVQQLQSVPTLLDQRLKVQRSQLDKDTVSRVKETKVNLTRFIKYLIKHV